MKKVQNILFIFLLWVTLLPVVSGQCVKKNNSFQIGEKLNYQGYYNWGFIWVHAGELEFSIKSIQYQSKQVFHFQATGNSLKSYDWIYKVRDTFQSYAEINTLQPLWFEKNTYEGGYKAYEQYSFIPSKDKIISEVENSKQPYKKDSVSGISCIFDVLSAIYYCRNINFENYSIDEKIPVKTIIEGEIYSLYMRYKGKEIIKTREGKRYRCIKFSALLVEGTIFKGGEDMFIWVTDDANRIPVLVEAKILIGSVKAFLIKTEGLRNQQTAQITKP